MTSSGGNMLTAAPIQLINSPNFFSQLVQWEIVGGNSASLCFQIQINDNLPTRRWMPALGASIAVKFMRARQALQLGTLNNPGNVPNPALPLDQSVTKTAVQDPNDRSLWTIALSATDTQAITSGTVQFTITEGSNTTTFQVPYMIKRIMNGSGC